MMVWLAVLSIRATQASAETTYYVTVAAENSQYGQTPDFEKRISPALPAGASLSGNASCSEMYVPGHGGETESATSYPNAGSYQLVTASCASEAGNPLTLNGVTGNIQILGGVYTVAQNATSMAAAAVEAEASNHEPLIDFTAEVIDDDQDYAPIGEQTVTFSYELPNGVWFEDACSAVTTEDGDGNAYASCVLSGEQAEKMEAGTGEWRAAKEGSNDYAAASTLGEAKGSASRELAASQLQELLNKKQIEIVPKTLPPSCRPANEAEQTSLFLVGLGELNCTELKALQVVTGVVLTVVSIEATGVGGPASLIEGAAKAAAEEGAQNAVRAYDVEQAAISVERQAAAAGK
jgi:hypothetical protein